MEPNNAQPLLLLQSFLFCLFNVAFVGGRLIGGGFSAQENPFTPKASLVQIRSDKSSIRSEFLISKASPLNAVESATFAKLAAQNSLPTRFPDFCSPPRTSSASRIYPRASSSTTPTSSSPSTTRKTSPTTAMPPPAALTRSKPTPKTATSRFTAYSDGGNGKAQSFKTYTHEANAGNGQSFTSYGKNGNGVPNEFASYGVSANVIGSGFSNYGEKGNAANDSFTSYGSDGNVPQNNFKNYGALRQRRLRHVRELQRQIQHDSFSSYAKDSNSGTAKFTNYGQSFNPGSETFTGYGKGAEGHKISFKTYTPNSTFKDYAQNGVGFAKYNVSSTSATLGDGKTVNKWIEPGKFFREASLKEGTLPFSTSKLAEINKIFHAGENSTMEKIISDAVTECERSPSVGETKRCVGSAEDMIDFATSVLGRSVVLRTTENVAGSKQKVVIGKVNGINGGKVTKAVSCHQSLYPYLMYYCHSVPKVRVYEADLLDLKSKTKINHGIAICHIDTSSWGRSTELS
ncbi:LOW QUALITY PROTEIN: hypothetical protein HID58_095691 [Brassica napus]|uniref:BURP domain-containing protein n=1 Tax=Brassica napus TaxID=3708 RepID=A0ABQ7X4V4_BRANA|nr:LOW QUALITY PROTEIN: hypothetical protein HID58_095691 [Brassica napus]